MAASTDISSFRPGRLRRLSLGLFSAFAAALLLFGALAYLALHLEDAVRSYVKGESLWSKAQKEAVLAVKEYAADGDEAAWLRYRQALRVPLADRQARLALQREPPDLERARDGLLQGGLDPGEVDGMIRLFRWFGDWGPMRRAIRIWTEGDSLIADLRDQAERIRAQWESPPPDTAAIRRASARVDTLNAELSVLEAEFTNTIDHAADLVRRWSLRAIGGLVGVLLLAGGLVSWRVYRVIERREAELARSRERLVRILDSLAEGITILASTGEITYANAAAERILGLTESEILDRRYDSPEWEITDADGEPVDPEELPAARSIRTGEPVWDETLVVGRPGADPVILSVNAVPFAPEGEEVEESIVSFRDVTERRRAERALRRAERRFRRIFEDSEDAIYVTDRDGTIVEMNPAGLELFGYTPEELVGRKAQEFYKDPDDRKRFQRRIAESGRVRGFETVLQTRNRGDRVCEITATPRVEDGEIVGYQGIIRDVTERKQFEERLRYEALHDPLTGLPNRTLFWDRIEHAAARACRSGDRIAVLYVDLDRFKNVNDSLGHAAGDEVLIQVARRLSGSVRESDTVARLGGDEFAVLLEGLEDAREVEPAAERIVRSFDAPFAVQAEELHLEVSVGAAELAGPCEEEATPEQLAEHLVRRADQAMFKAKDRPGTRFHSFKAADQAPGAPRIRQENELRKGLQEGEFVLHYQPLLSLPERHIVAVEPLVRWRHPDRGLLGPGEFLPLAEDTGLILELGRWVLEEAALQVAEWNRTVRDDEPLYVHPNVSAVQFEDPRFKDQVRAALEVSGLPPHLMELEVTETSLMRAPGRTRVLADLGVGICIDDFGTGYSSLGYVKELAADAFKIDMSFIHGIGVNRADEAIVHTVLMLGRYLELNVVAEGVETEDQVQWLEREGCPLAQGYWFARPAPADELEERLAGDEP